MSIAFDFHSLSFTIDHTLEEYRAIRGDGLLGMYIWETAIGDRTKVLKFRHEHAHLTSFLASGLADLQGIISDYLLVFLYSIVRAAQQISRSELAFPVFTFADNGPFPSPQGAIIRRAWQQVVLLRAVLFGYGKPSALSEAVSRRAHDEFWSYHFDPRYTPIILRFYRLLEHLSYGPAESELQLRTDTREVDRDRRFAGTVDRDQASVTSRAVMEAYALTIELLNTYFRKIETSQTFYSEPIGRDPGAVYSSALQYALDRVAPPGTTLDAYRNGKAASDTYNFIAALTFVAMQVPVLQKLDGEVDLSGTRQTLCPALRFVALVDAIRSGKVPPLPEHVRSESTRAAFLEWIKGANAAIGDPDTARLNAYVSTQFDTDPALRAIRPEAQSLIELSWAARANFFIAPNEYVLDAGLFAERYPSQARYIRTSDGKLIMTGDEAHLLQMKYLTEHAVPVLDAAIFAEQWDSTWAKFPEILPESRAETIAGTLAYCDWFLAQGTPTDWPPIRLRDV
jgi:hypothetical protein